VNHSLFLKWGFRKLAVLVTIRYAPRQFEPTYLRVFESGELAGRVERALSLVARAQPVPRNCGVNRPDDKTGVCRTGRCVIVSSYFPHYGEENCLRRWQGLGTIFLSACNLALSSAKTSTSLDLSRPLATALPNAVRAAQRQRPDG